MTVSLSPRGEQLVREKVRSGEFANAEAVVEFALGRLAVPAAADDLEPRGPEGAGEERLRALDEFFSEVDRDPDPGGPAIPEEALSRRNLYDNRRNRV
jgi:Arc/MetJ-type ribon-helix-helix transcriptional regulator